MKWEAWETWTGSPIEAGRADSVLVEADSPIDAAIEFRREEDDWNGQHIALIAVTKDGHRITIVRVLKELIPRFFAEVQCQHTVTQKNHGSKKTSETSSGRGAVSQRLE